MNHNTYMQRAIDLAKQGLNTTTPNPRVGCVIVKDGQVIGEGYHQRAGHGHAEVNALQNARNNGYTLQGASVYVTLEPCSHYGRTPPCAEALIDAGIAEVFIGSRDPNPQVSGRGVAKLRAAGIQVTEDLLHQHCDELNLGFFKRMTQGLPRVSVKLGMSLDAKIATAAGESQWITGEKARQDVQHHRARACAVMTSSATVIADNPSLNVRLANATRQPKRIIVDSHRRVSPRAQVFSLEGQTWVYHCLSERENTSAEREIFVPEKEGHADLHAVLIDLATRQQCNEVLVEAGGRFAGALLQADLVDELIIYTAPMLLGEGARPAFGFPAVEKLANAKRFYLHDCAIIGDDLKVTYRK